METAPRTPAERKRDTLARLTGDIDAWVATADRQGNAYLTPLSFLWDAGAVVLATAVATTTGRNLVSSGRVRLALGQTRDVVLIDGTVEFFPLSDAPTDLVDRFVKAMWDIRRERKPYGLFRVTPQRIQAWREVDEFPGRELMRGGAWLV